MSKTKASPCPAALKTQQPSNQFTRKMKDSYKQGLLQLEELGNYRHHIYQVHPENLHTKQLTMAIVLHPRDDKFAIEIGTKE